MRRPAPLVLERPQPIPRLGGRTFVVTGSASGLGLEAARLLCRAGADIVALVRSEARIGKVRAAISSAAAGARVEALAGDLSSRETVEELAAQIRASHPQLHGILHCAGLRMPERRLGPDGIELMFAVELLAPFLLTNRLLDPLAAGASGRGAPPSRIVFVSDEGHRKGLGVPRGLDPENLQGEVAFRPVSHAKHLALARILLSQELARRLVGTGVTALGVAPGPTRTALFRRYPWYRRLPEEVILRFVGQSPEEGAGHLVHAAAHPELAESSGRYVLQGREVVPSPAARSPEGALRLWERLEELLGERFLPKRREGG